MPLADYRALVRRLCPTTFRAPVDACLGRPDGRSPPSRDGAFRFRVLRAGKLIVAAAAGSRRRDATARPTTTTRTCRRATPMSRSISGCGTPSASTPWSISARTARWNGCPARPSRCRKPARRRRVLGPVPVDLSLHRQQSRRGGAGQAPARRRHHRPSDAAAHRGRPARRGGRARGADRRICRRRRRSIRGRARRLAEAIVDRARGDRPCAETPASATPRIPSRRARQARRLALRPQGDAHRRRPARLRPRRSGVRARRRTVAALAQASGERAGAVAAPVRRLRRRRDRRHSSPRSTAASSRPARPARRSRGRLDVLPTGRNLYTVDPRADPDPHGLGDRQAHRRRRS